MVQFSFVFTPNSHLFCYSMAAKRKLAQVRTMKLQK